eukprot:TRINITY_DN860_c0_g1_i2.p1 TRINITY_DN860_c0_g1~~TRINITY_DN860_c0_g1_i2.p1  ORF type:complete len:119 (+),score=17.14 TRINITY_DN860_c0_g1_i2:358-714(+)
MSFRFKTPSNSHWETDLSAMFLRTIEGDGVVAKCPSGYSQVGTLSDNNDIQGEGLGQSKEVSIDRLQKSLAKMNHNCVALCTVVASTEEDSTKCELSDTVTPDNNWGLNFRFCRKNSV